ncbi:MAG: hypothetical protein IT162_17210 [Bryobacterales bacterium]|nr:hypothetical protein [Bryobacterales bacterium]
MFLTTWYVSNLLLAALVFQLFRHRIYHELPSFVACTTFRLIQAIAISVAVSRVQFLSTAYLLTWYVTEPIAIVLVALASVECYVWLTRRIFRLGRIGMGALGAAALLGVVAMMSARLDSAEDLSRSLVIQLRFKQSLMGFLAVSLAVLLAFYRRFPLRVPHQAWPHAITELMYLAVHSLGYGLIAVGGLTSTAWMNEVLSVTWILCLSAWLLIFRQGVTWPTYNLGSPDEEKLSEANRQAERLERLL